MNAVRNMWCNRLLPSCGSTCVLSAFETTLHEPVHDQVTAFCYCNSLQLNKYQSKKSGRGKGEIGLGKGGAKRHHKILRDNIQGITKPAIRGLARRDGVKRNSGLIYEETKGLLNYLENVNRDILTYTEDAKRKPLLHHCCRHRVRFEAPRPNPVRLWWLSCLCDCWSFSRPFSGPLDFSKHFISTWDGVCMDCRDLKSNAR